MGKRNRALRWAVLVALLALAVPATASASGTFVSSSAPVGTGKSCASPGFNSIQTALNAAGSGAAVSVCGGTYTEQLEITQPVKLTLASGTGTARVVMPSSPTDSLTSCDTAAGLEPGQKDEISICTGGAVSIAGLTIEALAPIATCAGGLYGINVAGGAELKATGDTIVGASTTLNEYKGCQHGVAVEVGSHKAALVGHATLKNDTISGYEKNGPTVAGAGSTMKVLDSTITGEGPSPYIAQNGVEVAYGGAGVVKGTTVTANECELAGACSSSDLENQADGVLFYAAAPRSGVSGSTISDNDMGVYYASGSATVSSSPEVKISSDRLSDNRYEGVLLEEGKAALTDDTITGGGELGIAINQAQSQASGSFSSANKSTIEGMSVAAVGVVTDGLAGDPAGTFTIKNSSISKNAAQVSNPSSNFTVVRKNDT
jgi:hypothetical protein